jgi:GNAT superfamily N-acetyltransferase
MHSLRAPSVRPVTAALPVGHAASRLYQPATDIDAKTYELAANPELHPVFRGLLHEAELHEPQGVLQVASANTENPPHPGSARAMLVSRVTPRVRQWAQSLKERIAHLGVPGALPGREPSLLEAHALDSIGTLVQYAPALQPGEYEELGVGMERWLMAVLLSPKKSEPLGYCLFNLIWSVSANPGVGDLALTVDINEVWVEPEYQGAAIDKLLATALGAAVTRSANQVQSLAKWGQRKSATYKLAFTGGTYLRAVLPFTAVCASVAKESRLRDLKNKTVRKLRPTKAVSRG